MGKICLKLVEKDARTLFHCLFYGDSIDVWEQPWRYWVNYPNKFIGYKSKPQVIKMSYCKINTEEYLLDLHDQALFRGSRPDILYKIDVPKNLAKPAGKHLGGSPPKQNCKPQPATRPKETPARVLPREYCKTPKRSLFYSPFCLVF